MVVDPAERADITPVPETIVATEVLELVQDPPLTVELKLAVEPAHTALLPLIVPAEAAALMVTKRVAVALAQPPVPVTV
jgi:hypothetical protein